MDEKDGLFDVKIGAYHGAEVCELVRRFLFDETSVKNDKNSIGLYCDKGLSVFKNSDWKETFKDFGLETVAESDLIMVNYLDGTLNLNDRSFRPCHKPDDIIQYINKESNHSPNLNKHLPASIEKWLSNNSSDGKNV